MGKRTKYNAEDMARAQSMIKEGVTLPKVFERTGIPIRSLRRHKNQVPGTSIVQGQLTNRLVFSPDQERELAAYIAECVERFYGLTAMEARRLAAEFATMCVPEGKIPSSWTTAQCAGKDWLRKFLKRNKLSLRTPEPTSMARATGFNKKAVEKFFENFTSTMNTFDIDWNRVYNLDETGITNVNVCSKVIAPTGRKQVGMVTAAERGLMVTVLGIISANGNVVPPVMVFPLKKVSPTRLVHEAPAGTLGVNSVTGSGWMTADIFSNDVLPHIVKNTCATKENPILILLDNHASHVSLSTILYCRENGIHLVTFPPHCSHKLQPLDVSVYGPMKGFYRKALHDWQLSHPGTRVTLYDMGGIFGRAYDLAFTRSNIISGFRATGIFPLNSDVFNETDFLPASVHIPEICPREDAVESSRPSNEILSPESIRPLPRLQVTERKIGRKKGSSLVLTSSPEKLLLEERESSKLMKKPKRKLLPVNRTLLFRENSSREDLGLSDEDEEPTEKVNRQEPDVEISDCSKELDLNVGDFAVATVSGKCSSKNYVCKVLQLSPEIVLTFMRKRDREYVFFFPDPEDVAVATLDEILIKLPVPSTGSTARASKLYRFDFSFACFNL